MRNSLERETNTTLPIEKLIEIATRLENMLTLYNGEEKISLGTNKELVEQIVFKTIIKETEGYRVLRFPQTLSTKIDFTGISWDNVLIYGIDFSNFRGVTINPQTVWKKYFCNSNLEGITITENFSGCSLENTKLKGCNYKRPEILNKKNDTHTDPAAKAIEDSFQLMLEKED